MTAKVEKVFAWLGAGALVCFACLAICIMNLVTLSAGATTLKRAMLSDGLPQPSLAIECTVGPFLLGSARRVMENVAPIPPQVVDAVSALRQASVGVYRMPYAAWRSDWRTSDGMMTRRGWHRIVSVQSDGTNVVIYAPISTSDKEALSLCLAVRDCDTLVIVEGKIDADRLLPLIELQVHSLEQNRFTSLPARREAHAAPAVSRTAGKLALASR